MKDWRIYDYCNKENKKLDKPLSLRTPEVEAVWHNAFHEQVGDNASRIEDMLAATAMIFSGTTDEESLDPATGFQELIYSKAEVVQLSRRINQRRWSLCSTKVQAAVSVYQRHYAGSDIGRKNEVFI